MSHPLKRTNSPTTSSEVFGFMSACQAPVTMAKTHQHHEIELNFLVRGGMTYLAGGSVFEVHPGELTLFWAAAPHQVIQTQPDSLLYWFTLPLTWVTQWNLPRPFMHHLLQGHVLRDIDSKFATESDCARWHAELESGKEVRRRAAALELQAVLLRWTDVRIRNQTKTSPLFASKGSALAIHRMVAWIAAHYMESVCVEDITKPSGLHPNYAMTLFRKQCGMSVLDYLQEHRLFHAKLLLSTTDLKIIDVAMESGFGSLSRFYEVFTKTCGCTPRQFRKQAEENKPRDARHDHLQPNKSHRRIQKVSPSTATHSVGRSR